MTMVAMSAGMEWYLPVIWSLLLAVAIAMYVVLAGFD